MLARWKKLSRKRRILITTIAVVAVAATGVTVGVTRFLAPPTTPPDYTGERPEPAADGYVSHTETILVNVPKAEFHTWVSNPELELNDFIKSSEASDFPEVVGTDIVWGDWDPKAGRSGDRRRVNFEDGHYVAEEVLVDTPDRFQYMIWGFTSYQRIAVEYGVAEFIFAEEDGNTRITWTYSFQPTVGLVRSFLTDFMADTMSVMMRDTLAGMRDGAEAQLGTG